MSSNILALAAGAALVLSASSAEARPQQQGMMVPMGMDSVAPGWVVPAFLEEAEQPAKVVPTASLSPMPAPKVDAPPPTNDPEPAAAAPAAAEAAPPVATGAVADEARESSDETVNEDDDTSSGTDDQPDDEVEGEDDASSEPSASGAEDDGTPSDSDGVSEISADDGLLPGKVWVKGDNEEENDHSDSSSGYSGRVHHPATQLLPKKTALVRTPETLANEARRMMKEAAHTDAEKSKAAEAKLSADDKRAKAESKADSDAANAAAMSKLTQSQVVTGKAAAKASIKDALKDGAPVVAVNPAKVEKATAKKEKEIDTTTPAAAKPEVTNIGNDAEVEADKKKPESPAADKVVSAGVTGAPEPAPATPRVRAAARP